MIQRNGGAIKAVRLRLFHNFCNKIRLSKCTVERSKFIISHPLEEILTRYFIAIIVPFFSFCEKQKKKKK